MNSEKYFDICDRPFKVDDYSMELKILRVSPDGEVYEDEPTEREKASFSRNRATSSVISKEIAYKLALDPSLCYDPFSN